MRSVLKIKNFQICLSGGSCYIHPTHNVIYFVTWNKVFYSCNPKVPLSLTFDLLTFLCSSQDCIVWYSGQDLYIRPIHKLNARPRSECWTSRLFGSLPQSYMVTLYIKISKTCYFSFFVKHPINTFPFKQGSHKWRHTNLTQN